MLIWLNMLTLDLPGSHSTKKCSASLQTPMFHSFMERKPFMNWLHVFQGFTQTNRMWGSEGSLFVAVYNISWVYGLNQDQWKVKANECGCNIYITWGNHWYPAKEETPNIYIYIQKHELSTQSASNKKTELEKSRQHIQEASKTDEHRDMDGNTLTGHQYSTTWLLCHFLGIQSINDFSF